MATLNTVERDEIAMQFLDAVASSEQSLLPTLNESLPELLHMVKHLPERRYAICPRRRFPPPHKYQFTPKHRECSSPKQ